jgi:hypothetical protein
MEAGMLRLILVPLTVLALSLGPVLAEEALPTPGPLVAEDFETAKPSGLYAALSGHRLLAVVRGAGVGGGAGLRATYSGDPRGSLRIALRSPLPQPVEEASLCYDVRFERGFDFVRGGKLHGLGPAGGSGLAEREAPGGYAARVNFGLQGTIRSHLFTPGREGRFGISKASPLFRFQPGRYHAVTLHVKLNQPAGEANGLVRIHVDGMLLIEHSGLRFRTDEAPSTLLGAFLFSTFHGGNSPEWAPKNPDGSYATVHATFDNIAIYGGEHIRISPGPCWVAPQPAVLPAAGEPGLLQDDLFPTPDR